MAGPTVEQDEIFDLSGSLTRKSFPKAPNKKRFELDIEDLNQTIKAKELQLKNIQSKPGDVRPPRQEKDDTIQRRRALDIDLRALTNDIRKKNEDLTRSQSNLAYKNENKINDAIYRLEQQMKVSNLKLTEEKKVVEEINRLKRSKKALGYYFSLKRDVDAMRDRQRQIREERDSCYKKVAQLKHKEDEIRRTAHRDRHLFEELKKDIDQLYAQKRQMLAEFREQGKEFQQARDDIRRRQKEEINRKKEEEQKAQWEEYQKELAEREPNFEEKQLCTTLITYLQNMLSPATTQVTVSPPNGSEQAAENASPVVSPREPQEVGGYLLTKKQDDDLFKGLMRPRANKRSKREKRKSTTNKPICHTPQIFEQFDGLGLVAPSNLMEVPAAIEQLHEKKKSFEEQASRDIVHLTTGGQHLSENSGSDNDCTNSVAESALCESIPSTPEVQTEAGPPRFPQRERGSNERKLSLDSGGAYELEDQGSNDDDEEESDKITKAVVASEQVAPLNKLWIPAHSGSTQSSIHCDNMDTQFPQLLSKLNINSSTQDRNGNDPS